MANSNVVALSKIITLRNRSVWVLGSLASFTNGAPIPPGAEVVQQLNIQEQLYQALALNPPFPPGAIKIIYIVPDNAPVSPK
jgi:hypothetical protein